MYISLGILLIIIAVEIVIFVVSFICWDFALIVLSIILIKKGIS